jgi:pilus assembly protein CpaE
MRSTQLLAAASRGEMLVRTARNDPYSQAVASLARGLHHDYTSDAGQPPAKESRWVARMSQIAGFWKSSSEG